jgi:hypothetical protein
MSSTVTSYEVVDQMTADKASYDDRPVNKPVVGGMAEAQDQEKTGTREPESI